MSSMSAVALQHVNPLPHASLPVMLCWGLADILGDPHTFGVFRVVSSQQASALPGQLDPHGPQIIAQKCRGHANACRVQRQTQGLLFCSCEGLTEGCAQRLGACPGPCWCR